jgi:hypothetical protein
MEEVTRIFSEMELGDPSEAERLLPLVYDELPRLAAGRIAHERADHTLFQDPGNGTREKGGAQEVIAKPSPSPRSDPLTVRITLQR